MNEIDTLMLIIGLWAGFCFTGGIALWLTRPRSEPTRIKHLAFNMAAFNGDPKPRIRPVFQ